MKVFFEKWEWGSLILILMVAVVAQLSAQNADTLEPVVATADASDDEAGEASETDESEETEESDEAEEDVDAEEEGEDKTLDKELKQLRRERDLLSVRNAIRNEEAKAAIAEMKLEKERLALENALFMERVKAELIEQRGDLDRLSSQIEAVNKEASLDSAKARLESQTELAELKKREERLALESSLKQKEISTEMERLRLAETKLKVRRTELETDYAELQAKVAISEKREEIDDLVDREDEIYLIEPVVDGVLHISHRRVALNGPIWNGLAGYVTERINFFNNQSTEYPIFLVIDSSPGGTVMSGYRIIKAMEGSQAPVYVVVKSYAASMAAVLTTLAERSYAYPNAVILHHELSWYGLIGNLTQQTEYTDEAREWWRRLAEPVAEKMGMTLEEFRDTMYEKNSDGNWREFADVAMEYKWIDMVVDRIWETSVSKNPDRFGGQFWAGQQMEESRDENGRVYMELPRLEPFDFYFIHNPDGYYRIKR